MSVTVNFRKDRKVWQVTYYLQGVRKRPTFLEKPKAEDFARKIKLGLSPEDQGSISIAHAAKKYFTTFSAKKSTKSCCNDRRYLNLHYYFMTNLRGIERLSTVTLEDMEAFRDWLSLLSLDPLEIERPRAIKMGPSTVNRCLRVLKHFYVRHVCWKSISDTPCKYLEFLEAEEVERSAMTNEQYLRTLATAPDWFRPTLQFMYLTGTPAICIERIQWTDVNLERKCYSVLRKKGRKAKPKRTFFAMTDEVFALFVLVRNLGQSIEGPVFRDAEGRPLLADRVTRVGNDAIKAARITGVSLYGLRHALASDMTSANVSTEIVRQAMGHASIVTTQRYANKLGLRSVTGAIESVRGGSLVAVDGAEVRTTESAKVL